MLLLGASNPRDRIRSGELMNSKPVFNALCAEGMPKANGVLQTSSQSGGPSSMCRNIKTLFNFAPPATDEEIHAASLEYVRKVTGFNKPSKTTRRPSTRQSKKSRGSRSVCSRRSKPLHRLRTGRKRQPRRKRAQPYDSAGDHTDRWPTVARVADQLRTASVAVGVHAQ